MVNIVRGLAKGPAGESTTAERPCTARLSLIHSSTPVAVSHDCTVAITLSDSLRMSGQLADRAFYSAYTCESGDCTLIRPRIRDTAMYMS